MPTNRDIVAANFDQSTHNQTTSNAAALWIIEASKQYLFPASSATSASEQQSSYTLSAAGDAEAEQRVAALIEASLAQSTANFLTKIWLRTQLQPGQVLIEARDMVKLSTRVGDDITTVTWFLPLREVFATVHAALSDLSETAWPVPADSSPEAEREARLLELDRINESLTVAKPAICSTGIRHAWIRALDGYQGKRLPVNEEDLLNQTIRAFCHSTLAERLHIHLPSDKDPVGAARLVFDQHFKTLFLPWLLEGEIPKQVLKHFVRDGEEHTLEQALQDAFTRIGIIPDNKMQERIKIYASPVGIQYIPCDFVSILATLQDWLCKHASFRLLPGFEAGSSPKHKLALDIIEWLKNDFSFVPPAMRPSSSSSDEPADEMQVLYLLARLFDALAMPAISSLMLASSDVKNDQVKAAYNQVIEFLQALPLSLINVLLQDADLLKDLDQRLKVLEASYLLLRQDSQLEFISNFFAKWFINNKAHLFCTLSDIYFTEQASRPIIFLSDETIETSRQRAKKDGTLWVGVYHVNRVLLHALCYPPGQWTPLFHQHLAYVLAFIRAGFNSSERTDNLEQLQKDSYPDALLAQIDGLISQYEHPGSAPGGQAPLVLTPNLLRTQDSGKLLNWLVTANVSEHLVMQFLNHNWSFDVNAKDDQSHTLLHWAVTKDYTRVVEKLLSLGANTSFTNGRYKSALDLACGTGAVHCVELLLNSGMDIDKNNGHGTSLFLAAKHGHKELVELLLNRQANVNAQPLAPLDGAIESGNMDICMLLVQRGAINPLLKAASAGNLDLVKLLLKQGVDPNQSSVEGWYPICRAAVLGHHAVVKRLIKAGAKVDPIDDMQDGPLHDAICNKQHQIVQLLLDAGANPNVPGWMGRLPLAMAIARDDPGMIEMLLNNPETSRNFIHSDQFTFLHMAACQAEQASIATQLIEAGVPVDHKTQKGKTALHLACEYSSPEFVEVLIRAGADINALDEQGQTPLHKAVIWRNTGGIIRALLKHDKLDPRLVDYNDNSPLDLAVACNNPEAIERCRDGLFIQCLNNYARHTSDRSIAYLDESKRRGQLTGSKRFFSVYSRMDKVHTVAGLVDTMQSENFDKAAFQRNLPPAARRGRLGEIMASYFNGEDPSPDWLEMPAASGPRM